jgi:hypothetical protein
MFLALRLFGVPLFISQSLCQGQRSEGLNHAASGRSLLKKHPLKSYLGCFSCPHLVKMTVDIENVRGFNEPSMIVNLQAGMQGCGILSMLDASYLSSFLYLNISSKPQIFS